MAGSDRNGLDASVDGGLTFLPNQRLSDGAAVLILSSRDAAPAHRANHAPRITGIGAACEALDMPIVSGNVSLYNETDGKAILPTPTIGAVGLIDR